MDVVRYEVMSALGAGLGCLLYGLLLWRKRPRRRVQLRLALLLFALGQAYVMRAGDHAFGAWWFVTLQNVGFILFPLLAGLFVEALTRRHLPLFMKILLLAGTAFFGALMWFNFVHIEVWWAIALMSYQGFVLLFLYLRVFAAWRRTPRGPERAFLTSLLVGAFPVLALFSTDWLPRFGVTGVPRMAPLPVFLFVYLVVSALSASGRFSFGATLLRLVFSALGCVLVAGVVAFAEGARGLALLDPTTTLVLLFLFLLLDPLQRVVAERQSRSTLTLLERLHSLPRGSRSAIVEALRGWPELTAVELFEPKRLVDGGYDRLPAFFQGEARVVNRDVLWGGDDHATAEQLDLLLRSVGCDTALRVDGAGAALCVRFVPYMEQQVYGRALLVVAALLEPAAPAAA